jgi:hypothetical protein
MKGTWHYAIRKAMDQDSLYRHTVQVASDGENEGQWQIHGRILYRRGEGDADCIYMPPTAYSNGLSTREKIMCLIYQELAHFELNKYY